MEMSLQEKLNKDLVSAMKEKNELKVSVIRMALASFHKVEIEKRGKGEEEKLSPDEEIKILRGEAKRRKESCDAFISGEREDLAEKERDEISILSEYLPEEPKKEAILKAVQDAISETGAKTQKDFGIVMKEVMKTFNGNVDGSEVSKVIRELLSQ